jgi:two-component system NtrC family sensor kinase
MTLLEKIPTVITVAVLLAIFAGLKRHSRSARLHLWLVAWFFIFAHFVAQCLEPATGDVPPRLLALDLGSLVAAAAMFVASLSSVAEDKFRRTVMFSTTGVAAVAYAVVACYDVHASWPYVVCLTTCFVSGILFFWWVRREVSLYVVFITSVAIVVGAWAIRAALHGSYDEGLTALLGLGFTLPGIFICRNYWRPSAGIITVAAGFFCWGAVFPIGMLLQYVAPQLNVPADLWNTPKLFVAFGMILAIVEDKSESIDAMQRKQQALNQQLERFSAITSQLLSGTNPDLLCGQIASAITETGTFRIAVIEVGNSGQGLHVTGASGLAPEKLLELQRRAEHWSTDTIKDFCSRARKVSQNSFLLSAEEAAKYAPVKSEVDYELNGHWRSGDELLIPLCSPHGAYLGCIGLDDPRDVEAVNPQELSRIELLAADLAVAIELRSLQGQLVRSEKLAALGQLVAGVAHELNNPLTAVMGYGELLSEDIPSGPLRERVEKLANEGRRMKKIVENLLRFSRQNTVDCQSVNLAPLVQDVLALRQYYMRTHGLEVVVEIHPEMPHVAVDEDQFKQILLNLINNAIDAVETAEQPRRITVRGYPRGGRAIVQVEDSGPGFADLNRALDPFYTTKPVGKGTGLGLSICYGIIKEHEGDIRVENLSPRGARVTVELALGREVKPSAVIRTAVGKV